MVCRFGRTARRELQAAAEFYDLQRSGLGDAFLGEVERIVALLIENPELGERVRDRRRTVTVNRFPYRLVYDLDETGIRLIAVAHQKRHPSYWRRRVGESRPGYAILRQAA